MPRTRQRHRLPAAVLQVGWAGGGVISRGDEKIPNWYLSLLTADIKDLSLAEQKGKNIIFGLIRLFSLSKYRRLQGLTRREVLPNAHSDLPLPLCRFFTRRKSACLIIKEAFVVSHTLAETWGQS